MLLSFYFNLALWHHDLKHNYKKPHMELKTPKGTIDAGHEDALIYEDLVKKTKNTFKLYGAMPMDTPSFELKSILLNKYGEDTKLIYDLKETGGEVCALRYDLTVPFARYMSMNKLKKIKRYQFGKVYRRDQPSVTKGRLREFLQADMDIAGTCMPMIVESELISCIDNLLRSYNIGPYVIRVSDKRLLFCIMEVCGIDPSLYNTVSSSIDKLDKLSICDVNAELAKKGLNEQEIKMLNEYIKVKGKNEVIAKLKNDKIYEVCKQTIDELELLFKYCKVLECEESLVLDLSLARGLDYYTGIIIEGLYLQKQVGSVAGGGRYDNLVASLGGNDVPCAGFSIGLTRIFSLVKEQQLLGSIDVFVCSAGSLLIEERLHVCAMLRQGGVSAETFYTKRSDMSDHKKYCTKKSIPFLLVIRENEYKNGHVCLTDVRSNTSTDIRISDLVKEVKNKK